MLIFGNRLGFHDFYLVANNLGVASIVSLEVLAALDELVVLGVLLVSLDGDHDGVLHLV